MSVFKITELLNDVEKLKQALDGLSRLTCNSGVPAKRQSPQMEVLQSQVKTLQQQLAVSNGLRPLEGVATCGAKGRRVAGAGLCLSTQGEPTACSCGSGLSVGFLSLVMFAFVLLLYE